MRAYSPEEENPKPFGARPSYGVIDGSEGFALGIPYAADKALDRFEMPV
jgi:hypothetical protein